MAITRRKRGAFFWKKRKAPVIWGKFQPKCASESAIEKSLRKLFPGSGDCVKGWK